MKTEVPIEYLHERLIYDPASGELRWKSWRGAPRWSGRYAGKLAGCRDHRDYVHIGLMYLGRQYQFLAHRVAFAMAHGRWPADQVDHKNRHRSRNHLANLREATHQQNVHNSGKRSHNTSGCAGVYRDGQRWKAQIQVDGKRKHLGRFSNIEDASQAYLVAKQQLHQFYATGG